MTDPASRLQRLMAERGFLLPHHGAMAAGDPALHDAYLQMYRALTVDARALPPFAREAVWFVLLVVADEAIGTHHVELFNRHGGTGAQAEALISMAGFAAAHDQIAMARNAWGSQLPELDAAQTYDTGLSALNAGRVDGRIVQLAMICAQAARGARAALRHHLLAAYRMDIPEAEMLEALSYLIWPVGVNRFVEACEVWLELLQSGEVTPSGAFRAWAELPGQGAFDPAAGRDVGGFGGKT